MKIQLPESQLINIIDKFLTEQYDQSTDYSSGGATSTDSSGEFTSAGSWKQGGILTGKTRRGKDGRSRVKTDTTIPDSFTGGWQTVDTGLKTDGQGKISSAVGNNISQPDNDKQTDPRDRPALVNRYYNPYDEDTPRERQDPRPKGKAEKQWRSPPCCEPCEGGRWRRCQGGAKKPGACKYASISDCQLAGQPKGNIKPLKLKNIYENRNPMKKKNTIRLTERELRNLIKKVITEQKKSLNEQNIPGVNMDIAKKCIIKSLNIFKDAKLLMAIPKSCWAAIKDPISFQGLKCGADATQAFVKNPELGTQFAAKIATISKCYINDPLNKMAS